MPSQREKRWKLLYNGRPTGHAWFWDLTTGPVVGGPGFTTVWPHMVACADETGNYPDETMDGVLYLDPLGTMEHIDGNWHIPLFHESGLRCSTIGSTEEVHELAKWSTTRMPFRFV